MDKTSEKGKRIILKRNRSGLRKTKEKRSEEGEEIRGGRRGRRSRERKKMEEIA